MAPAGEWQEVRRRRRFPDNWRTPSDDAIDKVRPYVPYSAKPTFAQIVAGSSHGSANSHSSTNSPVSSPANSRSVSPPTPPGAQFFYSPHSPTKLRFPPNSTFPEWRGRCFRCCRTGHSQSRCRNPHKCGKCWSNGHIASQCKVTMLNPAARPFQPARHTYKPAISEPGFEELLKGDKLPQPPTLLEGRPKKVTVFIERDEAFFKEVDNLSHAVVMYCDKQALLMEVHDVVRIAVRTKLVRAKEVKVAKLSRERFLIHLPRGLAVETFVKALPAELWEGGFSFQQWSLLDDATVRMPRFKVLLDLEGIPMPLWKDASIINGISQLGLYLGTVQPEHASDKSFWRVAVAMEDIQQIPETLAFVAGGLEYPVSIKPVHWEKGPVYGTSDFPILPQRFVQPPATTEEDPYELERILSKASKPATDDDKIVCSRKVLMELCQGVPLSALPPEIRPFLADRQSVAEISMSTLEDLVFRTEDQTYTANTTQTQSQQLHAGSVQVAAQDRHSGSELHATVTLREDNVTPGSGTNMRSETKTISISAPESGSVLGTVTTDVKEGKKQWLKVDLHKEIGEGSGAQQIDVTSRELHNPHPNTSTFQNNKPQGILDRSRPSQAVGRQGSRSAPLMNFATSRHNRFRGMIGRGRGRATVGRGHNRIPGQNLVLSRGRHMEAAGVRPHQIGSAQGTPSKDKGPLSLSKEKYTWTRDDHFQGSNRHQRISPPGNSLGLASAQVQDNPLQANLKRKPNPSSGASVSIAGPSKKTAQLRIEENKSAQYASINLTADQFFQVHVDKQHCAAIGKACGIQSTVVEQILETDNEERQAAMLETQVNNNGQDNDLTAEPRVNLDSDSEEDEEAEGGEEC